MGGIIFRDLKPQNVLVTSEGAGDYAKLADFGLAKQLGVSICEQERVIESLSWQRTSSIPSAKHRRGELSVNATNSAAAQFCSPVTGTKAFMAAEAFLPLELRPKDLVGRDWYALGLCLLLMALGQNGGKRISHDDAR